MDNKLFHGVIPPIPTILFKDERLDRKGMANLIDFLIDSNVNGLFFLGSAGEFSQMTTGFRKEVTEFTIEYVNGRVPVLIGTGTSSTLETISLTKHAKDKGADGAVIINPFYWTLSEEDIYQHFSVIATAVDIPIMLYNYPSLTGTDLSPRLVKKLAMKHENIFGIKETVTAVGHIREMIHIVKGVRPDFKVFSGFDDHFLNTLSLGGDGTIPLTAALAPELSVGIYREFNQGNYSKAVKYHQKLASVMQLYNLSFPFMNVIKESIKSKGVEISTDVLPPVQKLSEENLEEMKVILEKYYPEALG